MCLPLPVTAFVEVGQWAWCWGFRKAGMFACPNRTLQESPGDTTSTNRSALCFRPYCLLLLLLLLFVCLFFCRGKVIFVKSRPCPPRWPCSAHHVSPESHTAVGQSLKAASVFQVPKTGKRMTRRCHSLSQGEAKRRLRRRNLPNPPDAGPLWPSS